MLINAHPRARSCLTSALLLALGLGGGALLRTAASVGPSMPKQIVADWRFQEHVPDTA